MLVVGVGIDTTVGLVAPSQSWFAAMAIATGQSSATGFAAAAAVLRIALEIHTLVVAVGLLLGTSALALDARGSSATRIATTPTVRFVAL